MSLRGCIEPETLFIQALYEVTVLPFKVLQISQASKKGHAPGGRLLNKNDVNAK